MIFGISGVDNGGVGHNIKTLALIDLKILTYHRICAILADFGAPGASFGTPNNFKYLKVSFLGSAGLKMGV